jgi:alkaline phosphatase D
MKVKRLDLGPIVGATTAREVRIWGRGAHVPTPAGPKPCLGVARIREAGAEFGPPVPFKLNPNFDLTGVVVFGGLKDDTDYDYQAGYLFPEAEAPDPMTIPLDWSEASSSSFRSGSSDSQAPRSFILGSCRYLLRFFGSWFDGRGDKTFGSVLKQVKDGTPTHALLMVGDQIYADDLRFVSPDRRVREYLSRYRDAFGQPYIRELMSRVPSYMTLDDHEIEDNWPANATRQDRISKYPAAIHACLIYQLSHSPLFGLKEDGRYIDGVPDKLWYTFADGCADFFVMDTRTERLLSADGSADEMVNRRQLDALKTWLTDGSGRVKFVVSAVPFFPDTEGADPDKWSRFASQRDEIIDEIVRHDVGKVVFLSGDIHCSLSAALRGKGMTRGKILSVISSGFFWPYPHSGARSLRLAGTFRSGPHQFEVAESGPVHATDNFTRVSAYPDRLEVEVYGRKGDLLGRKVHWFEASGHAEAEPPVGTEEGLPVAV